MPQRCTTLWDAFVALVTIVAAGLSGFGQTGCVQESRPELVPPVWTDLDTPSIPGTYFRYHNLQAPVEQPGATLSAHSPLIAPGANGGGFNSNTGQFSNEVYLSGPPWAINNPYKPRPSSCLPGVDCNTCEGPGEDCTGKRMPRFSSAYIRSAWNDYSKGLEFRGRFSGNLTAYDSGDLLFEAVYFHESPQYVGYAEYGFYRDLKTSDLVFYWSNHANCGYNPGVICSQQQGDTSPSSFICENGQCESARQPGHGCAVAANPTDDYYYHAWIFKDPRDDRWKFRVRVLDPGSYQEVVGYTVDPNAAAGYYWYPIEFLTPEGTHAPANQGAGYITVGLLRQDLGPVNNNMRYSETPSMTLTNVKVGR